MNQTFLLELLQIIKDHIANWMGCRKRNLRPTISEIAAY